MSHEMVWTFEQDAAGVKVICTDEDCINRYVCNQPCEMLYDIRRDESGQVTHGVYDWSGETNLTLRHKMELGDCCNAVEWLMSDPSVIAELNDVQEVFEIGRTPIDISWQGEGEVLWRRKPQPTQ